MSSPANLRFTESHEWCRSEDDTVTLGITQFAADEMTDITWVEMHPVGTTVAAGDPIGEVESVKTTNEIYSPFEGEIVEVNPEPASDPALLNNDPFVAGWLVRIKVTGGGGDLLDQATYDERYPCS